MRWKGPDSQLGAVEAQQKGLGKQHRQAGPRRGDAGGGTAAGSKWHSVWVRAIDAAPDVSGPPPLPGCGHDTYFTFPKARHRVNNTGSDIAASGHLSLSLCSGGTR